MSISFGFIENEGKVKWKQTSTSRDKKKKKNCVSAVLVIWWSRVLFFIFGICMPSVCLLSKSGGKEITFSLVFEAYLEFNCVTVDIYSFIFLSCL